MLNDEPTFHLARQIRNVTLSFNLHFDNDFVKRQQRKSFYLRAHNQKLPFLLIHSSLETFMYSKGNSIEQTWFLNNEICWLNETSFSFVANRG